MAPGLSVGMVDKATGLRGVRTAVPLAAGTPLIKVPRKCLLDGTRSSWWAWLASSALLGDCAGGGGEGATGHHGDGGAAGTPYGGRPCGLESRDALR